MMHFLALLMSAFVVPAEGADPGPPTIAEASLSVDAPKGVVKGDFTLHFHRSVRLYYPDRWGIAPVTNIWFLVRFESGAERFQLVPRGAMPKWPHQDGVQEYKAGERLRVPFDVGQDSVFSLRSEDGVEYNELPPGTYCVTAELVVPDILPTRRLALTSFAVKAPAVDLVVDSR